MKKALAGVLAVALAGVMTGSAIAQVPNVQIYFDPAFTQAQTNCGTPGELMDLYVVMNNWNMNVTGEDFSIDFSGTPFLTYIADNLPDGGAGSVSIGNSPTSLGGIAIAYGTCCTQDGFQPIYALRTTVLWGPGCDCSQGTPYNLVVRGYTPLGKTGPSAIRREDFVEFAGVGLTSLICPGIIATEPSTWGQVKALYR